MKKKTKAQPVPRRVASTKAKRMYLHQGPGGSAPLIKRGYDAKYRPDAASAHSSRI